MNIPILDDTKTLRLKIKIRRKLLYVKTSLII